jgi:adenylate kinase
MNHRRPTRPRRIIVFLGPQGSGKGTQAELLAKRIRFVAVSTGGLYRDEILKGTRLGKLAAAYINKGDLAPDEVTNALIGWRLGEPDVRRGVVLDGYPRTLGQIEAMDRIGEPALVFAINVPDKVALARISGRRACSRCDANYHLIFRRPKHAGRCDRCGGALVRRADDNPAAVKKRLRIYHKNTEPILAVYEREGVLVEIDGTKDVAAVAAEIRKRYKERTKRRRS